jgi:hypothetical protein
MKSLRLSATQTDTLDQILVSPYLLQVQLIRIVISQSDAVSSNSTGGLFYGVTSADGEIYLRTGGTKLVDDPASGAVDEDTVFWLCSQTKMITTVRRADWSFSLSVLTS